MSTNARKIKMFSVIEQDINDGRSCRPETFCKKRVLKYFTKFTGKHLSTRPESTRPQPATFLRKRL